MNERTDTQPTACPVCTCECDDLNCGYNRDNCQCPALVELKNQRYGLGAEFAPGSPGVRRDGAAWRRADLHRPCHDCGDSTARLVAVAPGMYVAQCQPCAGPPESTPAEIEGACGDMAAAAAKYYRDRGPKV